MSFSKCLRCGHKLKSKESTEIGYGPICDRIMLAKARELTMMQTVTVTDLVQAAKVRTEILDRINQIKGERGNCLCGTPLAQGVFCSYDHKESGVKVEGWGQPQWFYIHCLNCENQTALWKIPVDIRDLVVENEETLSEVKE